MRTVTCTQFPGTATLNIDLGTISTEDGVDRGTIFTRDYRIYHVTALVNIQCTTENKGTLIGQQDPTMDTDTGGSEETGGTPIDDTTTGGTSEESSYSPTVKVTVTQSCTTEKGSLKVDVFHGDIDGTGTVIHYPTGLLFGVKDKQTPPRAVSDDNYVLDAYWYKIVKGIIPGKVDLTINISDYPFSSLTTIPLVIPGKAAPGLERSETTVVPFDSGYVVKSAYDTLNKVNESFAKGCIDPTYFTLADGNDKIPQTPKDVSKTVETSLFSISISPTKLQRTDGERWPVSVTITNISKEIQTRVQAIYTQWGAVSLADVNDRTAAPDYKPGQVRTYPSFVKCTSPNDGSHGVYLNYDGGQTDPEKTKVVIKCVPPKLKTGVPGPEPGGQTAGTPPVEDRCKDAKPMNSYPIGSLLPYKLSLTADGTQININQPIRVNLSDGTRADCVKITALFEHTRTHDVTKVEVTTDADGAATISVDVKKEAAVYILRIDEMSRAGETEYTGIIKYITTSPEQAAAGLVVSTP